MAVRSKDGSLVASAAVWAAEATLKARLPVQGDSLLLLDPEATEEGSEGDSADEVIAAASEAALEVTEVVSAEEEASGTKEEAALAEEVGMAAAAAAAAGASVTAQHLPPMHLLDQVEVEEASVAVATEAPQEAQRTDRRASMAQAGGIAMRDVVAHMTTDLLTAVEAAVVMVTVAPEASLAVIVSR